mgnify:CR=1 FL=1
MKSVFFKTIPFSVFMMLGVNAYSQKVYELSDLSGSVNTVSYTHLTLPTNSLV